ncbi:hypothetical protein [Tepidibacter hydrothermalis]|uniref:Uncharacterized protein n=1 Tax=Tepidibacter hydrothermalis TaxID=3036126 RepID=A0ABY8EHJ2_9FIRM|nr:hypothetical protein [Tepidibacter hydrothermalis]WFD12226.1 hypothetical protein P4S50_09115 [Tepidibacter hydrothermalis]
MSNRNPKFNASGCADPTAYEALKPMIKEDAALEKKVHNVVNCVKFIVDWAGFELIGRIQIKDKKSGREFR